MLIKSPWQVPHYRRRHAVQNLARMTRIRMVRTVRAPAESPLGQRRRGLPKVSDGAHRCTSLQVCSHSLSKSVNTDSYTLDASVTYYWLLCIKTSGKANQLGRRWQSTLMAEGGLGLRQNEILWLYTWILNRK